MLVLGAELSLPFSYLTFLKKNGSAQQRYKIINSKYRTKRGMNRFAALNWVCRAELVSPAVNRLLPRFEQKMVKIPQKKLNKSFSIFGFLRGMNRFVPHWFIFLFALVMVFMVKCIVFFLGEI